MTLSGFRKIRRSGRLRDRYRRAVSAARGKTGLQARSLGQELSVPGGELDYFPDQGLNSADARCPYQKLRSD